MKKDMIKLIILVILFSIIAISVVSTASFAFADEDEYYIICKPSGEVNVREMPKRRSRIIACVFFGQKMKSDGKEENGFIHVIDLNAEVNEGWIYKGLLIKDQPIVDEGKAQIFKAKRVACRKYADCDSEVKKWLFAGENVKILAISEEWCVTENGYIKTEFLTINAPVRGCVP